jgi:diguanylate cyclase
MNVVSLMPLPAALGRSSWGPFQLDTCTSFDALAERLRTGAPPDAVVVDGGQAAALAAWPALSYAVLDVALVVLPPVSPELTLRLVETGVEDVLTASDSETLGRALRLAVERKRIERAARTAYATDLATGLPNHAQLQEHMTHLVALREREPAPMALIVLRIEGLGRVAESLGVEAANVLRRKAAVRLRSALRASDVVASVGSDAFAVLLAFIEAPHDGERVAAKLAQSLAQPFAVAGRQQTLAVSAGLASFPEHGKDADVLLRRALGQAAQVATIGSVGIASAADRGPAAAANDDEA